MDTDEFDKIRSEGDPLAQARRATDLMSIYQQRGVELARLRKAAIERAVETQGMTYSEVAQRIGLSKGRITQIRKSAPPAERALFGVGPLTLAYPVRASDDRPSGVVAVEDSAAAEGMTSLLTSLGFEVDAFLIPPGGEWDPPADSIVICGPKTSPISAEALANDPVLSFEADEDGQWKIRKRSSREAIEGTHSDEVAYVGRVPFRDRTMMLIAGVHAAGSVGAVHYMSTHLSEVYESVGENAFSMVIRSELKSGEPIASELLWGPTCHR